MPKQLAVVANSVAKASAQRFGAAASKIKLDSDRVADCGMRHFPRNAFVRMPALGHKRTSASRSGMSALPPKADMFSVEIDVCFVPIADKLRVLGIRYCND